MAAITNHNRKAYLTADVDLKGRHFPAGTSFEFRPPDFEGNFQLFFRTEVGKLLVVVPNLIDIPYELEPKGD